MRRKKHWIEEPGCARCPARMGAEGLLASVRKLTLIPSQRRGQAHGPAREVILTTAGKGTFRVRHRKNQPANQCPLLGYDVCRLDADARQNQRPVPDTDKSPARPKGRAACRELLMLALAGLI